ncbi:glycosyltransferase family 2 protein [Pseudomonas vancouverensis]|uniref:Glycosyltransferase n=1 Tax=Pseudomonas vancouverensis TaxID=95300 RepID=A0A1H2NAH4_PSEVA|nr:glycosyltransferase [Pseudomonas vancouverensis]KAB0494325.1 glycosyltransferase [Pseudomonas vancouverensis]TDB61597.1 glycosyltransferase [Pseudomonas vancouverensis]SDV02463.1 Glycosyltransferase, GT2 family [Pseudomonas vancouverensis]
MGNVEQVIKPRFSIVLVNYKTHDLTKICLDLLHDHVTKAGIPVWVVDNDSADASVEYLRSLDWINLIERESPGKELGHIAHGKALDMALARINTDYLFLMHTDTFVFDARVFAMMMDYCERDAKVVAVGCTEQLNRGLVRTAWRFSSRFAKHHVRRMKQSLGLRSKDPKPYREVHLKSFCTLWNTKRMKQQGLHFQLDDRVPGYTLQDRMIDLGYKVVFLSPGKIFKYLDHIQSGTVSAAGGYGENHRRTKMYEDILKRFDGMKSSTS